MSCDLLLRGGTLLDGTGQAARTADIAITGGRISVVGEGLAPPSAGEMVDIDGAVVCPGFIDLHSHADFTIMTTPAAPTQVLQGVTTLVTGNCGFSPFPVVPEHADELRRLSAFLDDGLSWEWRTAGEWAAAVGRLPLGVNIAPQVGHGALRVAAMGTQGRAPTGAEQRRMEELLGQCADDGVVGLSSGLIYPPGCYADPGELAALARVAARAGLLYSTHMRSEGAGLAEAVAEALAVARESGVRLQISHLKAAGVPHWGGVEGALGQIEEARAVGVDVRADQYPYSASSTTLTVQLPDRAMDGGTDGLLARLADPQEYRRLADELSARLGEGRFHPERVVLAGMPDDTYRRFVGASVAETAGSLGVEPGQAVLDLLAANGGQVATVNHSMSEEDVRRVMRDPDVAVASDGWILGTSGEGRPHPRSFGTFARVLGHYTRDERTLELPAAVRKMTALPASRLGWRERGVVRPGAVADLAVFDPAAVTDHATFDDPWQPATGVLHTLLAGRFAVREGLPTGAGAGRVLTPAADGIA